MLPVDSLQLRRPRTGLRLAVRAGALFSLLMTQSACIPWIWGAHYTPTSSEGVRWLGDTCPGRTAGPPLTLVFHREGVSGEISATEKDGVLEILANVKGAASPATLVSDDFLVEDADTGRPVRFWITSTWQQPFGNGTHPSAQSCAGQSTCLLLIDSADLPSRHFRLRWPLIAVGTQTPSLAPVEFRRWPVWVGPMPFNC